LGMKVCLDPLHSVSARPTVDGQKNSPVYEAVNKESRKNFFIGTNASLLVSEAFENVCLSHVLLAQECTTSSSEPERPAPLVSSASRQLKKEANS
jgi:hypothetical protein